MNRVIEINNSYTIRTEQHQGKPHLVVPVVMMVEGVHNGSQGAVFHSAAELGKIPESWNGIPVVVQHPEENGNSVSANSPELIEKEIVGRVYHTRVDGDKLKAELYLDEEKLKQTNPLAYAYIIQGRALEVSVGVFTDDDDTPGEWNGEQYEKIAKNHRPDHLALLPGETGACSWRDGCGIRINKEGGNDVKNETFVEGKTLLEAMKSLSGKGFVVTPIANNEQGYQMLIQSIQAKLDSMDNDFKMHYLQEVYEDSFVFKVSKRDEGSVLYKYGYQVNDDESIEFVGDPVEVRKKTEYVTMSFVRTKKSNNNNKKEVNNMS